MREVVGERGWTHILVVVFCEDSQKSGGDGNVLSHCRVVGLLTELRPVVIDVIHHDNDLN